MRKEWFLIIFAVGLAAVLNGCCKKQTCPACTTMPTAQAQTNAYESASAQTPSAYSGSRAVK